MDLATYLDLKLHLLTLGYSPEIQWAETVKPPETGDDLFREACWVILNSGMKNQVAAKLYPRVMNQLLCNRPLDPVLRHPAKRRAVLWIWRNRNALFLKWRNLPDDPARIAWLQTLPHIGPVTKFLLARNLGLV